MPDEMIRVNHVSFCYEEGGKEAVRDVSLCVPQGAFYAILGQNGSGKSTLAKLLNGLYIPNQGDVTIDGMNTREEKNTWDIRRQVGMVFQNPDNQLVATLVEEDVAFGPENLGLERDEIRRRVDQALDMVGMREYARHEPHRLSGGQKQRVAIAGVIAMRPECMILDEATAMLDPSGRKEVMETVEKLHHECGITVLMITHHMSEAARANRIIVLDDGNVLLDGTPEEVFSRYDVLRTAGLDVPQSAALIHGLRKNGIPLAGKLGSMNDCVETICRAYETGKMRKSL